MIYTIGHSTQSRAEFVARCKSVGIDHIIDVRSHPSSRWEWFNIESLEAPDSWLATEGIGYEWCPDLGGWSKRDLNTRTAIVPRTNMPPSARQLGAFTCVVKSVSDWAGNLGIDLDQYAGSSFPRKHVSGPPIDTLGKWSNRGAQEYGIYTTLPKFAAAADDLLDRHGTTLENPALMCSEFVWWKCHRAQIADYLAWRGNEVTHVQPTYVLHSDVLSRRLRNYPRTVVECWGSRRPIQ